MAVGSKMRSMAWMFLGRMIGQEACVLVQPKFRPWKVRCEEIRRKYGPGVFPDGRDFHHWLVNLKPLRGRPPPEDFIRYYVDTMSKLHKSEEEAVKKIYSVATKTHYAFGAKMSPEEADIIKKVPNVIHVYPDKYVDPIAKRYSLDPFINGRALPRDPANYECTLGGECVSDEGLGVAEGVAVDRLYATRS